MNIIAVMNLKGGVGKTTVAGLLVDKLAQRGRVLAIDADPQCDLSRRYLHLRRHPDYVGFLPPPHPDFNPASKAWEAFAAPPPGYWSTAQLLGLGYAEPYPGNRKNVSILPSATSDLTHLLRQISRAKIEEEVTPYLAEILAADFFRKRFDYIVIDTPPQQSPINASVLRAATHLIIPAEMNTDALSAIGSMIALMHADNAARPTALVALAGIVPTRYNPRAVRETAALEAFNVDPAIRGHLTAPMRQMITYQEPREPGRSILDLHPKNLCKRDALRWLKPLIEKVKL